MDNLDAAQDEDELPVPSTIKNAGIANNISLELVEIQHKNIPRVVYKVETNDKGRFLGIFKIAMRAQAQVDAETGEILTKNVPWWAFLVTIPEEPSEDDETDDAGNETGTNETTQEVPAESNTGINETIVCPQLTPPSPDFCTNGTIVSNTDENGCSIAPTCVNQTS